jgi:hypothetical protein
MARKVLPQVFARSIEQVFFTSLANGQEHASH